MDISRSKIEFIKNFLALQNEELIARFEKLLKSEKAKEDALFTPMSEKELNRRIDKSLKDAEDGKLTRAEDLLKDLEEWE